MAVLVCWLAWALVAYSYVGYPLLLVGVDALLRLRETVALLGRRPARSRDEAVDAPRVSVIIAAHDEADCIVQKIENTLALDHPSDRLQVLVGSDGSTDGTDALVRRYADRGVVLSAAPRGGKVAVLNRLSSLATGDLWLFTDANTMLERDALSRLVDCLRDERVGAASGRLLLVPPDGADVSEGLYWRYESLLKHYESRLGALMGANGGLYLLRASEWRPLPADTIVDDFVVTMRVLLAGRRVVYAADAVAMEESADEAGEFRRHIRIGTGNFQSLRELWPLALRADAVGLAFWSHKLLRWFTPVLCAAALIASLTLAARPLYAVLSVAQLAVLATGLHMPVSRGVSGRFARLVGHFVRTNVALLLGLLRALVLRPNAMWNRTRRTGLPRAA